MHLIDTAAPRPSRLPYDRMVKAVLLAAAAGFLGWFYALARPLDLLPAFLAYQGAFVATAALGGYSLTRREWGWVALAVAIVLFLLVVGLFSFPLARVDCEEWVANGRFRVGAF